LWQLEVYEPISAAIAGKDAGRGRWLSGSFARGPAGSRRACWAVFEEFAPAISRQYDVEWPDDLVRALPRHLEPIGESAE
jgi:hypothetical protein